MLDVAETQHWTAVAEYGFGSDGESLTPAWTRTLDPNQDSCIPLVELIVIHQSPYRHVDLLLDQHASRPEEHPRLGFFNCNLITMNQSN